MRAAALFVGLALLAPGIGTAQEITLTGPLRSAPSLLLVRRWREGRFALTTSGGVALGGGGPPLALVGAEAAFYPQDSIGVAAWAAAAFGKSTGEPASLRTVFAPEIVLVPVRGKLDLFDAIWLPYDVHVIVGGAWVTLMEGGARSPMPMAGLGTTFFVASSLSCGFEYRALADERGSVRSDFSLSLTYWPGDPHPAKYDDDE